MSKDKKAQSPTDSRPSDFPEYQKPPVVEVALSIQFNRLVKFTVPYLGLYWSEVREQFPQQQVQPPIADEGEEAFETPGRVNFQVRVDLGLANPRCLFISKDGARLIQIQQDRFVFNWRRISPTLEYPRYENVRECFFKEFRHFADFIKRQGLGDVVPSNCEITYVNQIESGSVWQEFGKISQAFPLFAEQATSDSFLPPAEDIKILNRYQMVDHAGKPFGRLKIEVDPATRLFDNKKVLLMKITARGQPLGSNDMDALVRFMDEGRRWVVKVFTSFTSDAMHKTWERRR
jgi:uncharacterized protein (TIGR04255 family)